MEGQRGKRRRGRGVGVRVGIRRGRRLNLDLSLPSLLVNFVDIAEDGKNNSFSSGLF
jgi:hypothetical protein